MALKLIFLLLKIVMNLNVNGSILMIEKKDDLLLFCYLEIQSF